MTVFPMWRIRLWIDKTGRFINRDERGRFQLGGGPEGLVEFVMRPLFRRMCSKLMKDENYF